MTTQAQKQTVGIGKFVLAGLIGGAIAAVINVILFFAGQALNGGPMAVTPPGQAGQAPLPLVMVIIMSILPGIIAGALYGILLRFTARAKLIFFVIAAIVFIFEFFAAITAGSTLTTIVVLELMHVIVAGLVIWRILGAART
jgi:Family of unknown function (DUF6069)